MTYARSPSRAGDVDIRYSLRWRKSSYSGSNGQTSCIEVALHTGSKIVRDSKAPDGPILSFPIQAWAWFVRHLPNDTE